MQKVLFAVFTCAALIIAVFLFLADFFITSSFSNTPSLHREHAGHAIDPVDSDIVFDTIKKSFQSAFPNAFVSSQSDSSLFLDQFSTLFVDTTPIIFQHWSLSENKFSSFPFVSFDFAILPSNISSLSAYTSIQLQIQSTFSSPLQQVIELNKYPEKSFTIRLAENQKTMYIVIVFKNRLLGVSCDLSDISRFKSIDTILLQVLSSVL